jgi:hypothetical protein
MSYQKKKLSALLKCIAIFYGLFLLLLANFFLPLIIHQCVHCPIIFVHAPLNIQWQIEIFLPFYLLLFVNSFLSGQNHRVAHKNMVNLTA